MIKVPVFGRLYLPSNKSLLLSGSRYRTNVNMYIGFDK